MKSTNLCCQVNPFAICTKCGQHVCELHAATTHDSVPYTRGAAPLTLFTHSCAPCTLKKSERAIREAILTNGPYSHNICSCALRAVAKAWGTARANCLIDKYKLHLRYKICKEEEK